MFIYVTFLEFHFLNRVCLFSSTDFQPYRLPTFIGYRIPVIYPPLIITTMYWKRWSYKLVGKDAADVEDKAGSPDGSHQHPGTALPRFLRPAASASPHTWWAATSTAAAVLLLGLYMFTPRPWLRSDHPARIHHVGCGSTPAEAEAAGCKFDIMSYTWVQPACFDQELMYDFLGQRDWTWYPDEETQDALTVTDVAAGQHEFVYVTWEYYTTHCTYSKSIVTHIYTQCRPRLGDDLLTSDVPVQCSRKCTDPS